MFSISYLDEQLFKTFARSKELLRQTPIRVKSRDHLKDELQRASGGVVFTTIQKFFPDEDHKRHPLLSDRRNIVVIADEAHRTQYGFIDGFARHLRDALPNASFIGFTGTPIDLEDRSTRTVFGDYISIYDIEQSIADGATVPIYYENRLVKLDLEEEVKEQLDEEFEKATEDTDEEFREELKSKYSTLEALVSHPKRIELVAEDLIEHFDRRTESLEGKAMIVCISREACVRMYDAITDIRPEWHSERDDEGGVKVVMSGSSSDESHMQPHIRSKSQRDVIGDRFKDPDDPLEIVIVCDMWLTGFDAPCAHTMYIDKPLKGHNLMQAVARVNRVFRDKPGGLVVDYIGVTKSLKKALKNYTESGGKGRPQIDVEEAVEMMREKYEICRGMLHDFDYSGWLDETADNPLQLIKDAANFVLELEDGRKRFSEHVRDLSKVYSIAGAHEEAEKIHDEVAFFQEVRSTLVKTDPDTEIKQEKVDHAVKQLVSRAIASDEVVDVMSMAGIERPDISVLSEEFLQEVADMEQKNLAADMLEKLIKKEIKNRADTNVVQSREFSEMLENAVRRYQNRSVEAVQVIEELLDVAREIRDSVERDEDLDLSREEIAFYDALAQNDSAVEVLGDDTLREMATNLTDIVRQNVTVDWMRKESARANLRRLVKRFLKRYGYPPDKQKMATETVVEQAERFGDEWADEDLKEEGAERPEYPYEILDEKEAKPFDNCVPLVDLEAAAGTFSEIQTVEEFSSRAIFSSDTRWAALPDHLNPGEELFVARVVGESMNRRIPDGTHCLFRLDPGGSRNGKVVLARHGDIHDSDLGGEYTVKVYRSEKEASDDGSWRHRSIRLEPDSTEDRYEPIVIEDARPGEFRIVAELVEVLGSG